MAELPETNEENRPMSPWRRNLAWFMGVCCVGAYILAFGVIIGGGPAQQIVVIFAVMYALFALWSLTWRRRPRLLYGAYVCTFISGTLLFGSVALDKAPLSIWGIVIFAPLFGLSSLIILVYASVIIHRSLKNTDKS